MIYAEILGTSSFASLFQMTLLFPFSMLLILVQSFFLPSILMEHIVLLPRLAVPKKFEFWLIITPKA
jgi:hypothetical protein